MDEQANAVRLEVNMPASYERAQLVVRLLIGCVLGAIHQSLWGIFGALYVLLPLIAVVLISQRSNKGYLEQDGPWLISSLEWIVGLYAYMLFVTDRLPLKPTERSLRLQTQPQGETTLPAALSRIVTSLPHALVLFVFGILSAVASLIMALTVLFSNTVPESLRSFQLRFLGMLARMLVYHASLRQLYPSFSPSNDLLPPSTPDSAAQGSV